MRGGQRRWRLVGPKLALGLFPNIHSFQTLSTLGGQFPLTPGPDRAVAGCCPGTEVVAALYLGPDVGKVPQRRELPQTRVCLSNSFSDLSWPRVQSGPKTELQCSACSPDGWTRGSEGKGLHFINWF